MTHATLMNWEIFLDALGFCCCALTVLYLIRLKRKSVFKGRISDPTQPEDPSPFQAAPQDLGGGMSFEGVLALVKHDMRSADSAGGPGKDAADPYDEVRRLLDLGMEPHQIAERTKIPECEIDLIVSLRQIKPCPVPDGTTESASDTSLA